MDKRESRSREAIPVAEIEAEIAHIEENGRRLKQMPGMTDEGRCRELCAMYLREFIGNLRAMQRLVALTQSETGDTDYKKLRAEEIDEFNAGVDAFKAGMKYTDLPDMPQDQNSIGWAWAWFLEHRPDLKETPSAELPMGDPHPCDMTPEELERFLAPSRVAQGEPVAHIISAENADFDDLRIKFIRTEAGVPLPEGTPLYIQSAISPGYVALRADILEFLYGAAPHPETGEWFGDGEDAAKGRYWWRKVLRDYTQPGREYTVIDPPESRKQGGEHG